MADPATDPPPSLWTLDDLAKLADAIAQGVLSVTISGPPARTIAYQSLDAMRNTMAQVRREIYGTPTHRLTQHRTGFRRGW